MDSYAIRLKMTRSTVTRFVALLVLLLHGGAYGAATVFDGMFAARANAAVAHVEDAGGGAGCVLSHDEATCQLCRVGTTSGCAAPAHFAIVTATRGAKPAVDAQDFRASIARTALHSRAPPIA